MKVFVTGATGFVGCHTAAALHRSGHQLRCLARDEARLATALAAVGLNIDDVEVAVGDITDAAAMQAAVAGCDGVFHAAGYVGTDATAAARMHEVNVTGARNVLDAAVDAGCGPIVHVSSAAALFPHPNDIVTPDDPPGTHNAAYARSKAAADTYARTLQDAGYPVVITYPTGVTGPHDPARGTWVDGFQYWLTKGLPAGDGLAAAFIDVRDLADIHAAVFDRAPAAGRYLAWGHLVTFDQLANHIDALTGDKVRRIPMPKPVMKALGWGGDLARRLGRNPTITSDVVAYLYGTKPADQSRTAAELGVPVRPFAETLGDALCWLESIGLATPDQIGLLAERSN